MPRKRPHEFWCKLCDKILTPNDFWYNKLGIRFARCKRCDYNLKQSRRISKRNGIDNRYRKNENLCSRCNLIKAPKDFYYSRERYYLCKTCAQLESKEYYYDKKNKSKILARICVREEIRKGNMPPAKLLQCFDCGKPANEYDHHLGYNEAHWLSVQPVCYSCHKHRTVAQNAG